MIEDTTFIIDVLRGDRNAIERLEFIEGERHPEKVSAITVLELYEGIERSSRPQAERSKVAAVLDSKHIIPATHELMQQAGRFSGMLAEDGTPIDREDCIIAATALLEDDPVITRNEGHFSRIEDIEVVTY